MRQFLNIDLACRTFEAVELRDDEVARAGRYLIAKTLLASNAATVDPLSSGNPLIFSAGPLAGTNFSNANRLSVGCKSPLTGGIKEANSGGTFATAMGHLKLAGFTLHGMANDWVVIRLTKDGAMNFDSAQPYLGKGNFEAAALLHQAYGDNVSIALCGPVGEYQGLLAGIAFSDRERRPARLAARGGVGAVMGSKKIKAIVIDFDKMPELHDRKKVMQAVREYGAKLGEQEVIKGLSKYGTAGMADFLNYTGGMPVRNFSIGRLVDPAVEPLKVGGNFIHDQNLARGGDTSHACMGGCLIKCSNVHVDENGKELVSPLEYETLGLLGTNLGLDNPDDIARLNAIANDLGIDTIETGAMLGVLMEAGQAKFGDQKFIVAALQDIRLGTERGRLLAQGTARVGKHFGVTRVPAIKQQAISAYDPRVVEVTGISMMTTAQGADHTAGNVPMMDCRDKTLKELVAASYNSQVNTAIADSLGLCVFGRSVTDPGHVLLANAFNDCHGTQIPASLLRTIGRDTLVMEREFNQAAGFSGDDDKLPAFFYTEALPPTNSVARWNPKEVVSLMNEMFATEAAST
ncbi:MAG: aldehyde ferredoxin oxidoreductase [Proteobacteria bacterium]|nr:aldehyde ferredoxin oxidoreductase [Pseudomonadota bacterium]